MCVELAINGQDVKVKSTFRSNGRVLIQTQKYNLAADEIYDNVYWDGWIKEEDLPKWTKRAWTTAEIRATKFNQRGRWYDVPPGQVVKGIAFNTGEKIILKVVTREAVGKEADVQERFATTGKRVLIPRS